MSPIFQSSSGMDFLQDTRGTEQTAIHRYQFFLVFPALGTSSTISAVVAELPSFVSVLHLLRSNYVEEMLAAEVFATTVIATVMHAAADVRDPSIDLLLAPRLIADCFNAVADVAPFCILARRPTHLYLLVRERRA